MAYTAIAVTGTVYNADKSVAVGATVELKLSTALTDLSSDVLPGPLTAVTGSLGTFDFANVVPNDDTTTSPANSYYRVTIISLANELLDRFNVIISKASAPTVDLFSLTRINVAGQPALSYGVTSINALTGPVTITSPDGSVTIGKTGQAVTLEAEPGMAIGNPVTNATHSALLATDSSGDLVSGPATSSVDNASLRTVVAATSIVATDKTIQLDATSGAITQPLPAVAAFAGRLTLVALTTTTNLVTLTPNGSDTITIPAAPPVSALNLGTWASGAPYTSAQLLPDAANGTWRVV